MNFPKHSKCSQKSNLPESLKFTWKSQNSQNAAAGREVLCILEVGLCTHYKTICIVYIVYPIYPQGYIPTTRIYITHFQQKAKHERGQWGQFGDRINKVTDPREWVDNWLGQYKPYKHGHRPSSIAQPTLENEWIIDPANINHIPTLAAPVIND